MLDTREVAPRVPLGSDADEDLVRRVDAGPLQAHRGEGALPERPVLHVRDVEPLRGERVGRRRQLCARRVEAVRVALGLVEPQPEGSRGERPEGDERREAPEDEKSDAPGAQVRTPWGADRYAIGIR